MPSCGKRTGAAALLLVLLASGEPRAQSSNAADLYKEALAREAVLRQDLAGYRGSEPAGPLLQRIRVMVAAYEDIARLFPTSGYSDNALWQGGILAADAFWRFGEGADRATALRLLNKLVTRFPTSSRVPKVAEHVTRLQQAASILPAPASPATGASAAGPATAPLATPPAVTLPPAPAAAPASAVLLKAIRREVLPDALRITLALDREVPFRDERLDSPPRVFLDLLNTRAADALKDATIPVGDEVVKQIRVGRQLDARTRVVVDLTETRAYSVYALYNPYRVVIDFERPSTPALPAGAPGASWPEPTPVAATEARPPAPDPAPALAAPPPAPGGAVSLSRQLGLGVSRIVIDPGHGGHDPGAKANGMTEAQIVLDIALRLEKLLKKQKGVEVVLTRRTNSFVSLEQRTAIANKSSADLFLSIHINASAVTSARGIETYFLNFAPNAEAEAIASRENAGSARTMRHLPDIVEAIALNNKINESRDFATIVQATLYERLHQLNADLRSLGVKQAPFMVLVGASMPSVLAEISFMTNQDDAALLKTEKYRQQIADALFAGVMRYQESLKKVPAVAGTVPGL